MYEKERFELSDELIRQALSRDFEEIEPPSAEKAWLRIEAGLSGNKAAAIRRRSVFSRYGAVAAAACLLLALGGIGLFQVFQQGFFTAGDDGAEMIADEAAPSAADERAQEDAVGIMVEEEQAPRSIIFYAESDPAPPDWPLSVSDHYHFDEAVLLESADRIPYSGAVYHGPEETLLLIESTVSGEEQGLFIDNIGLHLDIYTDAAEELNDWKSFVAEGQPGLAWQKEGLNRAVLVLSGFLPPEELQPIAEELIAE